MLLSAIILCFAFFTFLQYKQITILNYTIQEKDKTTLSDKHQMIDTIDSFIDSSNLCMKLLNDSYDKYETGYGNLILNKQNKINIELDKIKRQQEDLFWGIANDVATEIEYEIDVYDCTEFAKELRRRINNLGFNSKDIHTNIECSNWEFSDDYTEEDCLGSKGGHRIVRLEELYIEATSGYIIMPEDYERYGIK